MREAFIENATAFERKSPQMRHALEPLLGDGLFVSDGLVWKERRRAVTPVTHVSRMAELAPVMTEVAGEWQAKWRALPDGAEIDALEEMAEMTAEIICRTLFGRRNGQRRGAGGGARLHRLPGQGRADRGGGDAAAARMAAAASRRRASAARSAASMPCWTG